MDYNARINRRAQMNKVLEDKSQPAAGQNNFHHNGIKQNMNISPNQNAVHRSTNTFQTGECTACRKPAICVCERCGDCYCSPDCQKKDWQSHRYICFPMPKLVQPISTLSTDAVYPVKAPLLTVNQIPHANPPNSIQQQPQNSTKTSQQNLNLIGHPQHSDTNAQQQQTLIKALQKPNNKEPKQPKQPSKGPTATIPTVELPKTNSHVTLTGFRTPNRCYVRVINPSVDDDNMLNARKIDTYGKSAKSLGAMPKVHSYAIAPYNGVMHRVEVLLTRTPANIRVLFIDRGVIATRNLKDLREISDEIISLKQYTCLIQLLNVSNYVLNEKLFKQLASYQDLDFKIKYERVENGVELLYWQTEKSLNNEIEQFCKDSGADLWTDAVRAKYSPGNKNTNVTNAKQQSSVSDSQNEDALHDEQFYALEPSSSTVNSQVSVQQKQHIQKENNNTKEEKKKESSVEVEHPTMTAPFEIHYFKVGSAPFKAVVLDISCLEIGYLGCIAQDDLEYLQTIHKQLESVIVSDKPYKPQLREYCIAKYENMWYRAQVVEIPNDSQYIVMYIDFTNEATLTSADIRHFPANATGVCKTSLCLIDGLPTNFSAELIKFLNEEIQPQTVITIDCVKSIDESEEGVVVVECKSLLDKIRKNNLLT